MPNYDYKCSACGAVQEVFHQMSEEPEVVCKCGEVMSRKVSGGTTTLYKSPGFTQYKGRNGQ